MIVGHDPLEVDARVVIDHALNVAVSRIRLVRDRTLTQNDRHWSRLRSEDERSRLRRAYIPAGAIEWIDAHALSGLCRGPQRLQIAAQPPTHACEAVCPRVPAGVSLSWQMREKNVLL